MTTVADCTGKKARRGDLGLELEVEAYKSLPKVKELSWSSKTDGSLRHIGMEYVSSAPIKCDDHKLTKLEFLAEKINKEGLGVISNSTRTSFHVHRNVSDWTPVQPWNAACAYWLFENLLLKYCGKHREGNQYCLRAKDASFVITACKNDIAGVAKGNLPFSHLGQSDIKYCGQNMRAIGGFGSIEYRTMRGSLQPQILHTWSNELFNLTKEASEGFQDPSALMDAYFGQDPIQFMSKFVSSSFMEQLLKEAGNDPGSLITENESLVCELAYCTNWDKWSKRVHALFATSEEEWKQVVPKLEAYFTKLGVKMNDLDTYDGAAVGRSMVCCLDKSNRQIVGGVSWAEMMAGRNVNLKNSTTLGLPYAVDISDIVSGFKQANKPAPPRRNVNRIDPIRVNQVQILDDGMGDDI